jgi:hypothetical protein
MLKNRDNGKKSKKKGWEEKEKRMKEGDDKLLEKKI